MFDNLNFKDRVTISSILNIGIIFLITAYGALVIKNGEVIGEDWNLWMAGFALLGLIAIALKGITLKWYMSAVEQPLKEANDYTNKASMAIETASVKHSSAIMKQTDLIKNTEDLVKKLSRRSEETKHSAQKVADKSTQVLQMSKKGQEAMHVNIRNMTTLKQKIETIAQQILELSEHTQQIGSIIGVVEDITEQTNMLALNAAVEAARAGEHGRGFAVVASEIRKLSDQSKQATLKITNLIHDIQQATNSTVMATEEGTKEIEAGLIVAKQVADTIDALRNTILQTVEAVESIVSVSKEQFKSAQEVSDVMSTVNSGIQEAVETIEKSKDAIIVLEKVSLSLRNLSQKENAVKE